MPISTRFARLWHDVLDKVKKSSSTEKEDLGGVIEYDFLMAESLIPKSYPINKIIRQ